MEGENGLLTGRWTAITDNTDMGLYSFMYYDDRGRAIAVLAGNHLEGGMEKEYLSYDFTGKRP